MSWPEASYSSVRWPLVIEILGEATGNGFSHSLTESVVAVADVLSSGGGAPTGSVAAVAKGAVTGEVASRVVAITDNLSAAPA